MSLYGKYRPQNFANLVGQDHIRQTLLHEIQKNSLTHAYLFAGPRGTGKTSTARLIAKALNCEKKNENDEPCDECDMCVTIRDGNLIDVIEIDAASNRGIDEIRDLREKILFAPTRAKTKIYIIDEVHMLTKEAFNALLKTLEEPPDNVYFILCTTEIHKIPDTIISRCQRFDFKRIDARTIMTRLNYIAQKENIKAEDAAIELIARHVEGGLRDAIGLLEQMAINNALRADHVREHLGISGHETIETLIDLLEKRELQKALHLINEVYDEGYDLTAFVREILECLRQRLINNITQGQSSQLTAELLEIISRFEEARDMLRTTVIPQLPLEIAAIKIVGYRPPSAATATVEPSEKKEEKELEEPVATQEAQKEEQKTAATLKEEFDMERYKGDIQKTWPRVLEHVTPPSLRRSLSDAKAQQKEGDQLTLIFNSRFHYEKVNLVENKAKVEHAIEHVFGEKIKITCKLNASNIDTTAHKKTSSPPPSSSGDDIVKKAMEMFGEN